MGDFQPITNRRLYRVIAKQIKEKIASGKYKVGARLPAERDLAAQLQVSRTSVREALIALEIEGVIDIRVGSGVFVLANKSLATESHVVNSNEINSGVELTPFEILDVHLMLEPNSAALASVNASTSQIDNILRIADGNDFKDLSASEHNIIFHNTIAQATGNAALASTINSVWLLRKNSTLYSQLESHFEQSKIWQMAEDEHMAIAQAIAERNTSEARRYMRAHFTEIRGRLRKDFNNKLFKK